MSDIFLNSLIPISMIVGIVASSLASLTLVFKTFSGRFGESGSVLSRLQKVEAAMRQDTSRIDFQLLQVKNDLAPANARLVVDDLSAIASDLERRNAEMQKIIGEVRNNVIKKSDIAEMKRIVDLGIAVGQTESRIKAVLSKIDRERQSFGMEAHSGVGD